MTTFAAVFFDLDGTLADTAPDLAAAANWLAVEHGMPPAAYESLRTVASDGDRGLIGVVFGKGTQDPEFPALRDAFLDYYETNVAVRTCLFDGMDEVLARLEAAGIRWGIVTNKIARFTVPLVNAIGLARRASAVVSGDTTPHAKPHPAPLLRAAELSSVVPSRCIYVGDDLRDIQAGRAAGMATVAAAYGYCGNGEPPETWGADYVIHHPVELIPLVC
ncbi:HAD-IA family hydrolase [Burkholderia cenocepacia]|uniref:HAD-IA family hydrolase n=1 Tax=Burkholderia cenocepacia TaxID=95486 RepID=UPI00196A477F|nr:HAD-IA family hydrolase [Burkholderia cenocepacia]MBN3534169.1 HAD-IA family hydrolase [Burkholderia cenocepacia]MBR8029962.1 HAD-IA family hydrolase [Burkholderia cenocepacia]MBR8173787.1 HAD-IA family hydrolase [Burkholderia cenocepacia]MBR8429067.1 HAD-IA family hydrolase [Burkholderia cenocepacia]MBU9659634.1 HAD-IA family hydrolase [Burkholderia cenocepacia]